MAINPVFEKDGQWFFNVGEGHPTFGPYATEAEAWQTDRSPPGLPEHLGGHNNVTHIDRGTLLYVRDKFVINNMIDIGCGLGGMVQFARDRGIEAYGVDGDFTLDYSPELKPFIGLHDYTQGPRLFAKSFDLGWSVEFLEHVEEQYQPNYMASFAACEYVVCTAAPPGYPGHHHVNCRDQEYWIEVFGKHDFVFDPIETANIRKASTMMKPFMQNTGMFFKRPWHD